MIVVSDTSAITNLIAVQRETLLHILFGTVVIPPAVQAELFVAHAGLPSFINVKTVRDAGAVAALLAGGLDLGEAEAIQLTRELRADFLLIDEKAGREIAEQCGLRIIGVLGVLARAKSRGLISAIRPDLDALRATANFRIAPALYEQVLRDLGEA